MLLGPVALAQQLKKGYVATGQTVAVWSTGNSL